MRNSLLPIAMTLLVALVAVLLIRPGDILGAKGPEIFSGIFRLPKDPKRIVPSVALQAENRITVEPGVGLAEGIEPDSWRTVVVAAADASEVTRSVVLALAERLTERGCMAIIDVDGKQPLPIGCDRLVRVARVAGDPPETPGACAFTVRFEQLAPRFAAGHPANDLAGALGTADLSLVVAHSSTPAQPGPTPWSNWYAGIGRSIGDAALAVLAPGGDALPRDWSGERARVAVPSPFPVVFDRPQRLWLILVVPLFVALRTWAARRLAPHRRAAPWRAWLLASALIAAAVISAGPHRPPPPVIDPGRAWASHLPLPPQHEVVHWRCVRQDELVRGWLGEIRGRTTSDRSGTAIPAVQPLLRLLEKSGVDKDAPEDQQQSVANEQKWREIPTVISGSRLWQRERDGVTDALSIAESDTGWDLVFWQERPGAPQVHANWLEAAGSGDATARRHLRRHLGCSRIPEDQQAEAIAILRRSADVADAAAIAATAAASDEERRLAQAARFVLGREPSPPAGEPLWPRLQPQGPALRTGARPLLVDADGVLTLVLPGSEGIDVWSRAGAAAATRSVLPVGGGTVGALVITRAGDQLTVVCP